MNAIKYSIGETKANGTRKGDNNVEPKLNKKLPHLWSGLSGCSSSPAKCFCSTYKPLKSKQILRIIWWSDDGALTTRWSMFSIFSLMLVYWPPTNLPNWAFFLSIKISLKRLFSTRPPTSLADWGSFFIQISLRSLFSTLPSGHRPQEQSRMRCAGCRFWGENTLFSILS